MNREPNAPALGTAQPPQGSNSSGTTGAPSTTHCPEKLYRGARFGGRSRVTVDGEPLRFRTDLRNHSPTGFEWGYCGSGPAQLALAILADHLGDDTSALLLYQDFKQEIIASMLGSQWSLTSSQIDVWLTHYRRRHPDLQAEQTITPGGVIYR